MSIFDQNLVALQKKHPTLHQRVLNTEMDPAISLRKTNTQYPTLVVQTESKAYALHHLEDPLGHAHQFLSSIEDFEAAHNMALVGGGLGYVPLLMIQKRPDMRNLFVFEPSLSIFKAALSIVDFTNLLNHPGVQFFVGSDTNEIQTAIHQKLMEFTANSLLLIETPSITSVFPEWAAFVKQRIKEAVQLAQSGLKTKFKDGPVCLRNLLLNMKTITESPGISEIENRLENIPAVVVAAGPSLKKNIELLKELQDHFLIIATDTAFHPLREKGIQPHIVVTVDPTPLNDKHFPRERYDEPCLMAFDPEARPEIIEKFQHKLAYMTDKHEFFSWLDQQLGSNGCIKKGLMVSQAGIQLADFWGCSPIILIGQDLALDAESGLTHAAGTALCRTVRYIDEDKTHVDIPLPSEQDPWSREPLFWVEGIDGKQVPTVQNLMIYLNALQRDVGNLSSIIIDATEGGAKIRGTQVLTLREVIDSYKDENIRISERLAPIKALTCEVAGNYETIVQSLQSLIAQRLAIANEALSTIKTESHQSIQEIQRKISDYQQKIFSDPAAEYLIEYAAPKELFSFMRLGPANLSQAEREKVLKERLQTLLEAVKVAEQHLREFL